MALTDKQLQTLQQVARREIAGARGKDGWRFAERSGEAGACSNTVMRLSAKGLVCITYHDDTAQVALSERGRNLLKKETT